MSEKGHCQMEIVIPELWKRNKAKTGEDKGKAQQPRTLWSPREVLMRKSQEQRAGDSRSTQAGSIQQLKMSLFSLYLPTKGSDAGCTRQYCGLNKNKLATASMLLSRTAHSPQPLGSPALAPAPVL